MKEMVIINFQSLLLLLMAASGIGVATGFFMVRTYVRTRGSKTKAQRELSRLAGWISRHKPEAVKDAAVVDIAIDLIKDPQPKERWRI